MRSSSCRRLALASNLIRRDLRTAACPRRRVGGSAGGLLLGGPALARQQQHHGERSDHPLFNSCSHTTALAAQHGAPLPRQQTRGKKTRTSVNLADLPQGPIQLPPDALPPVGDGQQQDDDGPAYPTVVLQARHNMARFENCVLLTRVGGFYELYFEHAEEYGPLLNLKVAQKKTNAGPVPMAGFPFFQLDRFLKALVQELNCYVAVAEEFPIEAGDRAKSGLMHDRRVTRVITPGTLIDENFIDPYANNYVLAIHLEDSTAATGLGEQVDGSEAPQEPLSSSTPVGLSWLDVTTGQFYTQATTIAALSSILSRVGPREIVVDKALQSQGDHVLFSILAEEKHLITYTPHTTLLPITEWEPMLESEIPPHTITGFSSDEVQAGSLLLQYVRDRLLGLSMKLQPPVRHESLQVMTIDKNSMRSLEIKQTIRDGVFKGSLLHAIRRTVTKGGARLLNTWLSAPSTDLETITRRQDLVEHFIQNPELRDQIVLLLKRSHDSQRLVQKFAFGRGEADDLVGLGNTIGTTEEIVKLLSASEPASSGQDIFGPLLSRISLDGPSALADRIRASIDEDGLFAKHQLEDSEAGQLMSLASDVVSAEGTREEAAAILSKRTVTKVKKTGSGGSGGGRPASLRDYYDADSTTFTMKPGANRVLTRLHRELNALLEEKLALAETLRERFGTPSLTLRWTPNLGHICHVKGTKDLRALAAAASSSSSQPIPAAASVSRSTRTFHLPEWTALGQSVHQKRFAIGAEEGRLFADLRAAVVRNLVRLRRTAAALDELDVTTSFARLAAEHAWVRPRLLGDGDDGGSSSNQNTAGIAGGDGSDPSSSSFYASRGRNGTMIIGGRHPTVEVGLREQGRTFTANDCLVGASPAAGRLWLITGPNMAGKSTYLRQNALMAVLAQTGSWVPAAHAELAVADAVYSRVGSGADNLSADQSTFMVEMLETAQILRAATPRSLVIMDEVGRGTTPEDGAAVAFAALWHLATVNRCRALFATHFHTLADQVAERGMHVSQGGPVECYCTDVEEDGKGGFFYVHKIRKGINRHSHALKVARMAGLPEVAITVASDILAGGQGRVDSTSQNDGQSGHLDDLKSQEAVG